MIRDNPPRRAAPFRACVFALFMLGLPVSSRAQSPAQAWYRSNAAGIALERVSSRFAALRQPYCLLIEEVDSPVLPPPLLSYYRETWIVERRVLYKDGEESRVQWILRDGGGVSRVVAVFNAGDADADDEPLEETLDATDGADTTATGADATGADTADTGADATGESGTKFSSGFIELYGANGLIELERQLFDTGEETLVEYQYRQLLSGTRQLLIRADTRRTSTDGEGNEYQEDLYTDYYRYTRNYSLRAIERIFYQSAEVAASGDVTSGDAASDDAAADDGATSGESVAAAADEAAADGAADDGAEADGELVAVADGEAAPDDAAAGPPRTVLRFPRRSLDSKDEESFVSPSVTYGSQFLEELQAEAPERVVYDTDERGRILGETRWGEDGELIAEMRNEWSDNRLSRVVYTAGEDEMVTEYEYNADGDRITERNYRNGVLERVVHISGNREDEELYMDGELILRAQWEGGRKISEERVRSSRSGGRTSP